MSLSIAMTDILLLIAFFLRNMVVGFRYREIDWPSRKLLRGWESNTLKYRAIKRSFILKMVYVFRIFLLIIGN